MLAKDLRIVIFMGLVEGPDYYTERFIDYLKEKSIPYYVADAKRPETYTSRELDEFVSNPNTVMFTYNNVGLKLNTDKGENFWKKNNVPIFDYILDHPRLFSDSMLDPEYDLFVFTLDKDHKEFIERYYPRVKAAYFSPNGGTEINKQKEYHERDIDVIYMGDCNEMQLQLNAEEFEDGGREFYSAIMKSLIEDNEISTEKAIETYFIGSGVKLTDDVLLQLNVNYATHIENAVRRYYKLEGIKALDDVGVHVDIYGLDWEDEDYPFSDNITIHERIRVEELMDLIGRARISLCFVPWFKKGCSEKNFDSMLNGALCVTDRSEYLLEHYKDGYNIIYFDLNNPTQMAADIRWLLDNPDEAEIIAKRGFNTAKMYDTWNNRFDNVIRTMVDVLSGDSALT